MRPQAADRRFRWASPGLALALGGLALLSAACVVPLAVLAHQPKFFNVAVIPPLCAAFAVG